MAFVPLLPGFTRFRRHALLAQLVVALRWQVVVVALNRGQVLVVVFLWLVGGGIVEWSQRLALVRVYFCDRCDTVLVEALIGCFGL